MNLEIVRQGYGKVYTVFPFKHKTLFQHYSGQAQQAHRGLWSAEQPKASIVYITRTGAKYHSSTCRYLKYSRIPIELEKAKQSYTPRTVHDNINHNYNNYGNRPNNTGKCDGYQGGHSGWDVEHIHEAEAPFYSLTAGKVIHAAHPDLNDINILSYIAVYNETDDKTILYLHPSKVKVDLNQDVDIGTPLGNQGNTGNSTAPHVHVEVRDRRTIYASCGIEHSKISGRPNEDPIPYLFEWVNKERDTPQKTSPDVNQDGSVNIVDILLVWLHRGKDAEDFPQYDVNKDGTIDNTDLLEVIENFDAAAAPSTTTNNAPLSTGTPRENALLPNYPNPFNPETWIPYQLANASNVQIIIYNTRGTVVRQLDLGHQREGYYTGRSRAAYWDGTNDVGESVSSGIYFYQLRANDVISPLRKMVILK